MESKFHLDMDVFCIKDFENLRSGNIYYISGSGDLLYAKTPKTGYGFGVTTRAIVNIKELKESYFTEGEMYDYFITIEESLTYLNRNNKLTSIGINE